MSINHYSSEIPETQWWSPHHRATMDSSPKTTSSSSSNNHHKTFVSSDDNSAAAAASFWLSPHQLYSTASAGGAMFCRQSSSSNNAAAAGGFDLNNNEDEEDAVTKDRVVEKSEQGGIILKDRLFEKPLTPSDVGKLNRLVIPKQHAEKHFPLNGGADSGESGLLLGFEDEVGKAWRFRYSYWNSSQSYVLTKGWSRFVKEKRLDAGDIVVFARHRVDSGRLFIGWRRRNSAAGAGQDAAANTAQPAPAAGNPNGGGGGVWNRAAAFYSAQPYPISRGQFQITPSSPLPNHSLHPGSVPVLEKQTTGSGNPKRLRLFGVNMECQLADDVSDPSTPVGSPMSSQGHPHHPYHHHQYNHMDSSFSGGNDDVYRQG
ncbi:hypothetical protein ACP275_10G085800 [Erythranthe tilingii]